MTEVEDLILNEIRKNNQVDRKTLSMIAGRSERTVQRILDALKQKERLRRIGTSRKGYWELID